VNVIIINGPNLNLLGVREKSIYGDISFDEYLSSLKSSYKKINIQYFQTNIEGEIIDKLQEIGFTYDAIILNAGGYTHTSVAISDCIKSITTQVYEVHISNIYNREEFRRKSLISSNCKAVVCGLGLDSYRVILEHLYNKL
tara:strand:+ start:243 stop:665 length:423 start_codon:yes stop_codon:yes gene_type:complete